MKAVKHNNTFYGFCTCFKYLYITLGHDLKLLKCVCSSHFYIHIYILYDTYSINIGFLILIILPPVNKL